MKAPKKTNGNNKSVRSNDRSAITSRKWYQDFTRHVQLLDLSESTCKCYLSWIRRLHGAFPRRHITRLKEEEVLDFLISLRRDEELSDGTVNQALCSLRAFYRDMLERDWKGWSTIRIRREQVLPNVLSVGQVARFLAGVREGRFRALFTVMYHCGLRLSEATHLKPGHIDSSRRVLRVVRGKGRKDREVPISDELIARLRAFWKAHRNPEWLFPATGRGWKSSGLSLAQAMGLADKPMSTSSVQAAMRATVLSLGWDKRDGHRPVSCHTLRHCYATHLLDAGVSVRLVSEYLGHASLKPTLVYLHLTEVSESRAREVLARFPGL